MFMFIYGQDVQTTAQDREVTVVTPQYVCMIMEAYKNVCFFSSVLLLVLGCTQGTVINKDYVMHITGLVSLPKFGDSSNNYAL